MLGVISFGSPICGSELPSVVVRPTSRRECHAPAKTQEEAVAVVEAVRRVLLTGVLAVFANGGALQIGGALLVAMASHRVYAGYAPFVEDDDDKLAELLKPADVQESQPSTTAVETTQ